MGFGEQEGKKFDKLGKRINSIDRPKEPKISPKQVKFNESSNEIKNGEKTGFD